MTFIYTPPEPIGIIKINGMFKRVVTIDQLRAEVERVRREIQEENEILRAQNRENTRTIQAYEQCEPPWMEEKIKLFNFTLSSSKTFSNSTLFAELTLHHPDGQSQTLYANTNPEIKPLRYRVHELEGYVKTMNREYETQCIYSAELHCKNELLRAEVERVQRETIEACAVKFEGCYTETGEYISSELREMLK